MNAFEAGFGVHGLDVPLEEEVAADDENSHSPNCDGDTQH